MPERRERAAMVTGGPTVVLDLGGLRVVSDPAFDAPALNEAIAVYNQNSASSYHLRSPEQIGAFFEGLTLVPPGLVPASRWQADGTGATGAEDDDTIVGVGRKP
jgi:S-adenosyl methyltransferase